MRSEEGHSCVIFDGKDIVSVAMVCDDAVLSDGEAAAPSVCNSTNKDKKMIQKNAGWLR